MPFETILYESSGGLAVITLNRPDKFNAFTQQMHGELKEALKTADRDAAVRALIITGSGKAFCTGQDLGDLKLSFGELVSSLYNPLIRRLREIEKPIVAAINGVAAGAGMAIALACDLRIASDRASFTTAFIKVGLVPDSSASYFLPRLVGLGKAMELVLLGDRISAADAERLGLVNRTVPESDFPATWQEWGKKLAAGPRAQGFAKRLLNRSLTSTLDDQLDEEARFQQLAGGTADGQEGIAAFLQKRAAQFQGK